MPSRKAPRFPQAEISDFLRSINVQLDAAEAVRIAHFRPTAKAAALLEKLFLGPNPAILVTAPYGSGKSLSATYALHLLENRDAAKSVLRPLAELLGSVSPSVGAFAARRVRGKQRGITLAIQGHAPHLRNALCGAFLACLERQGGGKGLPRRVNAHLAADGSVPETLQFLLDLAAEEGFDRLLLVWDEFGRHLESLVSNGRPSDLHDVQQLAEIAARSKRLPFRMCVLLHQGFGAYAASAPDTVRREWKKVEDRFERTEYIDDSKELLRLLADLVESVRGCPTGRPDAKSIAVRAKALLGSGLFKEFAQTELAGLLERVFPLDGATLYLLPRISARVAQNERTLFNFLQSTDLSQPVHCDALFRYFEPAMRQDTGVGGTYRAMLETNSATAKCSSEDETRALQTACVLTIGLSGNRTKISRELLRVAMANAAEVSPAAVQVIDALIERKLLLYRRHSDEVSVWHGTDVNLRERIAEQRLVLTGGLDLVSFLSHEWPLPATRATEHNDRLRMHRFFERRYLAAGSLSTAGALASTAAAAAGDGTILHLLPAKDLKQMASDLELAKAVTRAARHRLIVTVPSEPVALESAALEVAAIMALQKDRELLDTDPFVVEELRNLEDDARTHMLRQVERVTSPNSRLHIVADGRELGLTSPSALRRLASKCCDRLYSRTPVLANDQVNRRRPSPVIVNARKKLVGAILESSGRPDLGFGEAGFRREIGAIVVAQYRAVIKNSGLYRHHGKDRWGFAAPSAIKDSGLAAVWEELRQFFTQPSVQPKQFTALVDTLSSAPYGVRAGVLPILIACATRAFPVIGSMTCDGQYVRDIRPSVIEDLCKAPQRFALSVVAVEDDQRTYLEGICDLFRGSRAATIDDPDLVRRAFEWIQFWKTEAPEAARVSGAVAPRTAAARKVLWSTEDPVRLLLHELPAALEADLGSLSTALHRLEEVKLELDGVVSVYTARALEIMCAAVGDATRATSFADQLKAIQQWAEAIPESALDAGAEPRAKGVVIQLASAGTDAPRLANMISARLTKAITRWDDTEVAKFQQEFRRIVDSAEDSAFAAAGEGAALPEAARERLAALVERRITHQLGMLTHIVGQQDASVRVARAAMKAIRTESTTREPVAHGKPR